MSEVRSERDHLIGLTYAMAGWAWDTPELGADRTSATPQQMYIDQSQRCPVRQLSDNTYAVLRMDDLMYINKHPATEQMSKYLGSDRPAIPLGLDGEEHRTFRRLLDPVFAPKRVAPLADQVRALANELIDGFIEDGAAEAYGQWCDPLPSTIFLSIMGLPLTDREEFLHFKRLTLGNYPGRRITPAERVTLAAEGVTWIQQYFNRALDERAGAAPADDMLGWLMSAEVDGRELVRQELLDILGLLMIAGLDTVAASLSCSLSYLARNPEQRARLIAEPALMRSAVEELIRSEAPVTEGFRTVTDDITLPSGAKIPAGSHVLVSWAAANLDPRFFERSAEVDFGRSPNAHVGFASGIHRCLGSHLARMELCAALEVWHQRIPDYSIEDGCTLEYSGNPRAPYRLPLVWPTSTKG